MKILFLILICSQSFAGTDFKKYRHELGMARVHRVNCQFAVSHTLLKHEDLYNKFTDKELDTFQQTFCASEFPLPKTPPECEDVE